MAVAALCVWAGCGGSEAPVIGAGASTPLSERPDDVFARIDDNTVIPAFEFGLCETNDDCAPQGCGGAMCSTAEDPAVCHTGDIASCFAELPSSACGCVEGACRWARIGPVNQCAVLGADRPTNRPVRGVEPGQMYPIRND